MPLNSNNTDICLNSTVAYEIDIDERLTKILDDTDDFKKKNYIYSNIDVNKVITIDIKKEVSDNELDNGGSGILENDDSAHNNNNDTNKIINITIGPMTKSLIKNGEILKRVNIEQGRLLEKDGKNMKNVFRMIIFLNLLTRREKDFVKL